MFIVFDTETTGFPKNWNLPYTETDNWPRVVQIAWQVHDEMGRLLATKDYIIRPEGFDIPYDAEKVHGISTQLAVNEGHDLTEVLLEFNEVLNQSTFVVGHNLKFDKNVVGCEFHRLGIENQLQIIPLLDTMTEHTANLCRLPGGRGGKFKWPSLSELHQFLFDVPFSEAHNATADVEATTRCFFELIRREEFTREELKVETDYFTNFKLINPSSILPIGLKHVNLKEASLALKNQTASSTIVNKAIDVAALKDFNFVHLHTHSQFSILQSTISIPALVQKTADLGLKAVALTDLGNMMAAFHFEKAINGFNKKIREERVEAEEKGELFEKNEILPIIGCTFYVCANHLDKSQKDNGYQVVFIAKNKKGYQNLIKLSSIAFTAGFYYVPRIDKTLIEKYSEDIIVLSGNLLGEIPSLILNVGENQAEEALVWWKNLFGQDFYLEIMRHGQENENRVNETLIRFSEKHDVKLVATNNTYYLNKEDAIAHDILLCVKDGELQTTPIGRGRGFRFGLENQEYYYKSAEEMKKLFVDLPQAIASIDEITSKIEPFGLAREVLLPAFDIPEEFQDPNDKEDEGKRGENNYLRYLTYKGAEKRYTEISDEIRERIDFELATIERTGYPGYFLIVQDFCQAARDMGVSVGPGRGSAAGSVVAYCIGITNVDPIKYDLLFERFLNPDRISMPDIDIDFDDEGRGRVIDWVIQKYGSNQVAQIITYGTMAAKSSIRDTARVLDLPLFEADKLAKLVPDISLKKLFSLDESELNSKLKNNADSIQAANELKRLSIGSDLAAKVIQQAKQLEGSVRNTGIHACGVIITPDDITNFVPVATAKDSDMWCTQFDNSVAEEAGLLKMDFLGLKTLTLIKYAVKNVFERHGIQLDPDNFPIDDLKTYELFQRGETVGIFQYESAGMQKYMRELKPTVFADLIAMNALYRPGPLEYIPSFIRRKHGEEPITYDIDACEEYLKETYGITVYQEQVMLLSQKLAGFSKGEADTLRKAMGKKQIYLLDKMRPQFIEQGNERGHDKVALEKIWKDWEAFASYAFNKSHSTCYAWIAYQTAYLKANYPAEYMASVLSNNMNDIKQVSFFMEECKRMGVPVLGPDINESSYLFTVNNEGAIRFGLGAIKGLGSGPVEAIIQERTEKGAFSSIFDVTKRINLRVCTKRAFESLVYAGGFDSFKSVHRAQYIKEDNSGRSFLESAIKFGANFQESENSMQASLFGEASGTSIPEPEIPKSDEWPSMFKLSKEKEVVGIFLSGHPLDDFRLEIESFCNGNVAMLSNPGQHLNKEVLLAAVVSECESRISKKNEPFGTMVIEDYTDSFKLFLFKENYLKYKQFFVSGTFVAIRGKFEVPRNRKDPEFIISSIDLLYDLRDKKANQLNIRVSTKKLDQIFITDMNKLFLDNQGKCAVKFVVFDPLENIEVVMPSKSIKIDPNNDFIKSLRSFEIDFDLS